MDGYEWEMRLAVVKCH